MSRLAEEGFARRGAPVRVPALGRPRRGPRRVDGHRAAGRGRARPGDAGPRPDERGEVTLALVRARNLFFALNRSADAEAALPSGRARARRASRRGDGPRRCDREPPVCGVRSQSRALAARPGAARAARAVRVRPGRPAHRAGAGGAGRVRSDPRRTRRGCAPRSRWRRRSPSAAAATRRSPSPAAGNRRAQRHLAGAQALAHWLAGSLTEAHLRGRALLRRRRRPTGLAGRRAPARPTSGSPAATPTRRCAGFARAPSCCAGSDPIGMRPAALAGIAQAAAQSGDAAHALAPRRRARPDALRLRPRRRRGARPRPRLDRPRLRRPRRSRPASPPPSPTPPPPAAPSALLPALPPLPTAPPPAHHQGV